MLITILEAAFRSAIMALTVWAGIRLLRLHHALAQKLAWALVLLAAVVMPVVMRAPFLALDRAIQIPLHRVRAQAILEHVGQSLLMSQPLGAHAAGGIAYAENGPAPHPVESEATLVSIRQIHNAPGATKVKPSPAHRLRSEQENADGETLLEAKRHQASAYSTYSIDLSAMGPNSALTLNIPSIHAFPATANPTKANPFHANWAVIRLLFSLAYIAVGVALLSRVIIGLAVAFRLWKRATPIAAGTLNFSSSAPRSSIRISPDLSSPVTVASTILLPANAVEWDSDKLLIVLAHEQSHVRQGDFYLQLAAAVHTAIFWFSPLGWWLQRKLSELGETLSDHAGLSVAKSPASYAQILLEFAAMPHKPLAGVAMARSSNLSSRIDRILSERKSRLAFLGSRKHAYLAALLVPAALVAVVACIRIMPAVEAAQAKSTIIGQATAKSTGTGTSISVSTSSSTSGQVSTSMSLTDEETNQDSTEATDHLALQDADQTVAQDSVQDTQGESVPPIAPQAPVAPLPPTPSVAPAPPPEPPDEDSAQTIHGASQGPEAHSHSHSFVTGGDDGEGSFAILNGKDSDITIYGRHNKDLDEAKRKYHNNFIWFERDGKSYVITDPAIVQQSEEMFKNDPRLELRQKDLEKMQAKLDAEMKNLQPEIEKASKPGPEFEAQMAQLEKQLATLNLDKLSDQINKQIKESMKDTNETVEQITQEKLGELQEKIGDIQGQIGEIQGKIGERQGLMGEKQGEIGERMGKVGEQMGQIGEEEGRHAEEASRKMKSVLDQAVKDGKAKPVD